MKPNIILITIDCLRSDHLGFMGYPKNISPNIDALAKESAVFAQAFAIGPGTPCSFPAILTSTYPFDYQGPEIKEPRVMISQVLKKQGYLTAAFHSSCYLSAFFGYNKGWDYFEDITQERDMWIGGKDKKTKIKAGFIFRGLVKPIERIIAGFFPELYFRLRYLVYKSKEAGASLKIKAESVNLIVKDLVSAQKGKNQPLFIWIHYMDVHGPYLPYSAYVGAKPLSYSATVAKSFPGFLQSRFFKNIAKGFIKKHLPNTIDLYDQGIKYVDEKIGELLDFLKKEGVYQNSIVCLLADHGDEFMEHGEASHNNKLYNELLHVPLLIKAPGIGNKIIENKISLIDLAPTICGLANVPPDPAFKGKNLFDSNTTEVFHQAVSPLAMGIRHDAEIKNAKDTMAGFQNEEWKYILDYAADSEELYDLKGDQGEKRNVVESKPEVVFQMRNKIKEFQVKNPPLALAKP